MSVAVSMSSDDRLTKNEKLVLEAMRLTKKPQKAYDLLDVLKERGIRAPMTIYRALEGLEQKGLVHKMSDMNAYVLCNHATPHPIEAFLVCEDCGNVQEFSPMNAPSISVDQNIEQAVNSNGFDMRSARIEVKGTCNSCNG